MNIIIMPLEYVREWINHATDAVAEQFINAVRPIYGSTKDCRPDHIGTCLFIEWKRRKYLLTAAHVIDNAAITSLYVGEGDILMPLKGVFKMTEMPKGRRLHDHYDFASLELSDEILEGYRSFEYIKAYKIIPRDQNQGKHFHLALGYPNSRNKWHDPVANLVAPQHMIYGAKLTESQDLCRKYRISSRTHLFLPYDKKSKDSSGFIVNSSSPIGASGGALIDMGLPKVDGGEPKGRLAGLLIEYPKRYKVIVAVKIHVILDCMVRAFLLEWLDQHIWPQIYFLMLNDAYFKLFVYAQKLTGQFNGPMGSLLEIGYTISQTLTIRRLCDKRRKNDVISIKRWTPNVGQFWG